MKYFGTQEPIPVDRLWDTACCRCGAPCQCQWAICANNKQFFPLCIDCDIALNRLILCFLNVDDPDSFIEDYREKLINEGLLDAQLGEENSAACHQ